MCYNVAYFAQRARIYARRLGQDNAHIEQLESKITELQQIQPPVYHAAGFTFPPIPVLLQGHPLRPQLFQWGLIPHWVQSAEKAQQIRPRTLNARAESLHEKPSFRGALARQRCVIFLDGFFEYHHAGGQAIPFYIRPRAATALLLAGLWERWQHPDTGEKRFTFSIITTEANPLMRHLHNNPKQKSPRMPAILTDTALPQWLSPNVAPEQAQQLLLPYPNDDLVTWPVHSLRKPPQPEQGPHYQEAVNYEELKQVEWIARYNQ